jgi:hypothetical protein
MIKDKFGLPSKGSCLSVIVILKESQIIYNSNPKKAWYDLDELHKEDLDGVHLLILELFGS